MGKVIKMKSLEDASRQGLVEHIEEMLEMAKKGEIVNLMSASLMDDGNVMTGYCNLDMGDKQTMISHVQVDINYQTVKVNIDELIEWV